MLYMLYYSHFHSENPFLSSLRLSRNQKYSGTSDTFTSLNQTQYRLKMLPIFWLSCFDQKVNLVSESYFFYKPSTFICRGNGFRRRRWKPLFSRNPRIRTDGIVHVRSRDLHLLRKVAWSKLWYHLLRQHRSGHVDGFPMCQHGGLDSRSVFGKLLSFFQSFSSAAWRGVAWRGAVHYAWSHSGWWRQTARRCAARRTIKGCSGSRSRTYSELQKVCLWEDVVALRRLLRRRSC